MVARDFGDSVSPEPQVQVHVIDLDALMVGMEIHDQGHQYIQDRYPQIKRDRKKIGPELDNALEVLAARGIRDVLTSCCPVKAMKDLISRLECAVALGMQMGKEEALKDAQAARN